MVVIRIHLQIEVKAEIAERGAETMTDFKKGDKVKVQYGGEAMTQANNNIPKYKRGAFEYYSHNGVYGWFVHNKTGKLLKRPSEEFLKDN